MKQLIILCATVALGIFLFQLIAGQGEDSVLSALGQVWRAEVAVRSYAP